MHLTYAVYILTTLLVLTLLIFKIRYVEDFYYYYIDF